MQVVAALEASQNTRNPDDFLSLFTADAVWVTAFGRRLTGLSEIGVFTRQVLTPALGDVFAHYAVEHLTFVAVANVRQTPIDKHGDPIPGDAQGSPTYVMVRENRDWKIAAGQNTKIQTAAIDAQRDTIAPATAR